MFKAGDSVVVKGGFGISSRSLRRMGVELNETILTVKRVVGEYCEFEEWDNHDALRNTGYDIYDGIHCEALKKVQKSVDNIKFEHRFETVSHVYYYRSKDHWLKVTNDGMSAMLMASVVVNKKTNSIEKCRWPIEQLTDALGEFK